MAQCINSSSVIQACHIGTRSRTGCLLLIQFSLLVCLAEQQMAHMLGPLTLKWEAQMELQVPDFSLVQNKPASCDSLGSEPTGGRAFSLSEILPFKQIKIFLFKKLSMSLVRMEGQSCRVERRNLSKGRRVKRGRMELRLGSHC